MTIICNKEEFAKMVVNCYHTEQECECDNCVLFGLCPSAESGDTARRFGDICEIEEE